MPHSQDKEAQGGVLKIRRGFSLIELLIAISIISLLIGLLMPALSRSRERARATVCLSNLRQLGHFTSMYLEDDARGLLPWYTFPQHEACDFVTKFTPWVFGGFAAPAPKVVDASTDSTIYPVEIRPLNKYAAPQVVGFGQQIDIFKCPSDRMNSTLIEGSQILLEEDRSRASWVVNGSSYTLNTRFMDEYAEADGGFYVENSNRYGERIAPHLIGGKASRFVLWAEQGFYNTTAGAKGELSLSAAPSLRMGWHSEHSKWATCFADGHVEYQFYDTRLSSGPSWTVWQPK
jgi:prepilin-type N-terminal cleavage/methylation domain-containing protein